MLQFRGIIASPNYTFPDETVAYTTFDMNALMGASGAPIFVDGDVVSLLNGIDKSPAGFLSYGPTWSQLKDFVGPVWEGEK